MTDIPPEIAALVKRHNDGGKLSPEEVAAIKAYRSRNADVRPEYADSMAAAAAMLEVSVSTLQAAKNAGSTAFRGGRVYLSDVEKFLAENDLSAQGLGESDQIGLDIKREALRKARFANDIAEARYIHIDEQAAALRRVATTCQLILRTALERRFPVVAEGKTKRQLRELGARLTDEICREMIAAFGEAAMAPPPPTTHTKPPSP